MSENLNMNQVLKDKWIAEAAYYKSLNRNFSPGAEDQDWIDAENKFNYLLKKRIKPGLIRIIKN